MYPGHHRQCPPNTFPYTIQAGDTFYSLAQRFNTSVPAIVSANPTANPYALMIGQTICIPRQPIYPSCPEGNYYRIRRGDTLYAVAAYFNVSLADLLEANPGIDPYRLFVGQVICIPLAVPPVTCPPNSREYIIRPGDTLFAIAEEFGTTVDALIRVNPGIRPEALLIGQRICVPIQS